MRVLHVIPSVAPRYGGTSTFIAAIADALNRTGDVTCDVAATEDERTLSSLSMSQWPAKNTPLHLFPYAGSERQKRSSQLSAWLRANAWKYDLIHSHSVWNDPVYEARVAAQQARKPLVISPHGMLSSYTWSRNRVAKWAYWVLRERANIRAATAFHCTSQVEVDELKAYESVRGTIHYLPLGVDDDAWTTPVDRHTLRERCGPRANGKPIVLFLSRLHPKKGVVDRLLPAFAEQNAPAFLAIVGGPDDGAPEHPEEIRRAIERLGLSDRVALLGAVTAAERWAMFDGADLFVLPSHQENFGLVVTEAMARGVPVLITDQVQSGALVRAAEAGLVVRASEFTSSLRRMLADQPSRVAMGIRGAAYARLHFRWNRIAGELAALYRNVTLGGS